MEEEKEKEEIVEVKEEKEVKPKPKKKKKKDDEGDTADAVFGCLMMLVIVAAVWALVHFNPSERDHQEKIAEVRREIRSEGYSLSGKANSALNNAKYHSLGVVSWTSSKYHGKSFVVTVGLCGTVIPLFDVQ
ncbi:MAG: hypothetical protein K2K82_02505 [Muribaculaceae bacterium]|nr:hypothetical protein [Muribaculaceae bacterium]